MHPIKSLRLRRKLSQEELAELFGCSQSLIALIEVGTKPVSPVLARKIEEVTDGELTRATLLPEMFGPIQKATTTHGVNHGTAPEH